MDLNAILAILRRRGLLFLPVFAVVVGGHIAWISLDQDPGYTATSQVLIGRDPVLPPDTPSTLRFPLSGMTYGTREASLTDEAVCRRAAELIRGLREFRSASFQTPGIEARIAEAREAIPASLTSEELQGALTEAVRVGRSADRDIVSLEVSGADSLTPLLFSWAMAEAAHQVHAERAAAQVERFEAELSRKVSETQAELTALEEDLDRVQEPGGLSGLEARERLLLETRLRLAEQESQLMARAQQNEKLIEARLHEESFLRQEEDASGAGGGGDRIEALQDRLFQEQLALESHQATLSAHHPEVQRSLQRIAKLERDLSTIRQEQRTRQFQRYSRETRELLQELSTLGFEQEVIDRRQAEIEEELTALATRRDELAPRLGRSEEAGQRLASLQATQEELTRVTAGGIGPVSVYHVPGESIPGAPPGRGFPALVLTILVALALGAGTVWLAEYRDTRVKTEQDVRDHLNLPLLATLPREAPEARLLTVEDGSSVLAEKFSTAATLLESTASALDLKSFMISSAVAGEGKTTVGINLAVALARRGSRVLLVDANLRQPGVHVALGIENAGGLVPALVTGAGAHEGILATEVENLHVLTAGVTPEDPTPLLEVERLRAVFGELRETYDFLVVDTPPINVVGDALPISQTTDGSILVVASGESEPQHTQWAQQLLANVRANLLGVFLNKSAHERKSDYYYFVGNERRRHEEVEVPA